MLGSFIRRFHSRQATIHTALWQKNCLTTAMQVYPRSVNDRFTAKGVRTPTEPGLHTGRVEVPMPLEIALPMQAQTRLPPASTQNWAFQADTRGFNDMPFKGFLGPSYKICVPTRILRRFLGAHTTAPYLYYTQIYINFNTFLTPGNQQDPTEILYFEPIFHSAVIFSLCQYSQLPISHIHLSLKES